MSKDTIDRQESIDALMEEFKRIPTNAIRAKNIIEGLPSAQPEITLESAIDYLCSIGWMQEHDRIMSASAQQKPLKYTGESICTHCQTTNCKGCMYEPMTTEVQ